LWVGGDAEPRIKTAFKAPVELSKILVEAPSGITHRHHEAFFFDGPEVSFWEIAVNSLLGVLAFVARRGRKLVARAAGPV
jgi:hypothetical protein